MAWRSGIGTGGLARRGRLVAAGLALLAGCADRFDRAADRARDGGLVPVLLAADPFPIQAFLPASLPPPPTGERVAIVFIESDGFAFARRGTLGPPTPTADPTPTSPLALPLAVAEARAGGLAAYLARPCQYGGRAAPTCHDLYWAEGRAAPPVIASLSQALDAVVRRLGATGVHLVGVSGGGIVAMLLAGERTDVLSVTTLSAPLDHGGWTRRRRRTPLHASRRLLPVPPRVRGLPQWHLLGAGDSLVIPADQAAVLAAIPGAATEVVPGAGHDGPWVPIWPALRQRLAAVTPP